MGGSLIAGLLPGLAGALGGAFGGSGGGVSSQDTTSNSLENVIQNIISGKEGTQTTINEYEDQNLNDINKFITNTLATEAPGIIQSGREAGLQAQTNFDQFGSTFLPAIQEGITNRPDANNVQDSPEFAIAQRFLDDSRGQQNIAFGGGFNDVGALGGSRQAGADALLQGRTAETLASSVADRALQERLGFANIAPSAINAAAQLPAAGIAAQIAPITALSQAVRAISPDQLTKSSTVFQESGTKDTTQTKTREAEKQVREYGPKLSVGDRITNVLAGGAAGAEIGQEVFDGFNKPKPKTVFPTTDPNARQGTVYKSGGA